MTEQEWLACADTQRMLKFLRGKANDRQLLLLAVACCRRIWPALTDVRGRWLIETAERYADRLATAEEMGQAQETFWEPYIGPARVLFDPWRSAFHAPYAVNQGICWCGTDRRFGPRRPDVGTAADQAQIAAFYERLRRRGVDIQRHIPSEEIDWKEEQAVRAEEDAAQAGFVRDVFGNPFRPVALDPSWLTSDVVALAEAAYEERELPQGTLDPARLAVLADALEDVGCRDQQILQHLRGPGPHVRGCWVIDLLLGKP